MTPATFTALADPSRFRIVELLREQPHSVNEVASALKLRQPQASKHLKTLTQAGLVSMQRAGQQRIYSLTPEPFRQLSGWLESFADHWNRNFYQLDKYLEKLKKER